MNRREQLVLFAALVVAVSLIPSTGGVSSVQADRTVQISVADDSAAYLGLNRTLSNTTDETTDLSVTVRNQFPSDTSLTTVCVTVGNETVTLAENRSIDAGEQATAEFDAVSCPDSVTVNASGPDVSVRLTRTVDCR